MAPLLIRFEISDNSLMLTVILDKRHAREIERILAVADEMTGKYSSKSKS
ncbi:MAG: hypothetical protein QW502_03415 [Candidatus Bathyarchaeia archaeon]